MSSVKERIAYYTLPGGSHRGVAWLKRGFYGMKWKIKIDQIIAQRYRDLSGEIRKVTKKM